MIESREERAHFVLDVIKERKPHIVAIDGKCASGKTSLVEDLAGKIDFSLVSMDDFFLPPEMKTPSRMNETGGNVHYERFIAEVIVPLRENRSFSYRRFSCRTCSYIGARDVASSGLVIVEGSYALHPAFSRYWDVSFLLTVDSSEQIRRLRLRSPERIDAFLSKWIPMENDYFESFRIAEKADYII